MVKETRRNSALTSPSDISSSTPPSEALRLIVSLAMTRPKDGRVGDRTLQFVDITRAHPHCGVERELYMQLPQEDPWIHDGHWCARLKRCLYGTCDAGRAFELFVFKIMTQE